MTAEMWNSIIDALSPYQQILANIELDTPITVVMESGYSITGEVMETDHPTILSLARFNTINPETRRITGMSYVDITKVVCHNVDY